MKPGVFRFGGQASRIAHLKSFSISALYYIAHSSAFYPSFNVTGDAVIYSLPFLCIQYLEDVDIECILKASFPLSTSSRHDQRGKLAMSHLRFISVGFARIRLLGSRHDRQLECPIFIKI
jgi:hypothetical protein